MTDRVPYPGQEGRVKITPEVGDPYYAVLEMADNPTQEGTALAKANLLSDATAANYFESPDGTETVDKVLAKLGAAALIDGTALTDMFGNSVGVQIATGSYTGTGTYGSGNPNSLTFDFEPKLVIIQLESAENLKAGLIAVRGVTHISAVLTDSSSGAYLDITSSWNGNVFSWYSSTDYTRQLNQPSVYDYFAIG